MQFKRWLTEDNIQIRGSYVSLADLLEVAKKDISRIGSRINKFTRKEVEDEPFNDIFGDKYRIIIPLMDADERNFLSYLSDKGLKDFDFRKGVGYVDVKTKEGVKKREIKIGKFLNNLKNKEWLDFWQKNKVSLGSTDSKGVSVVVSRHPIDIIRMSDHAEFSSCHSPGKLFWKCAIQEAKTGGAVAYIVRNRDLAEVKNLQAKEIFKDPKRKIKGIEPLERIRLRRFEDRQHDYLVPELDTYGIKHVGFYETVKQWALSAQKDNLANAKYENLKLRGGSYQDNPAHELWNSFVGASVRGEKKSEDQSGAGKDLGADVEQAVAEHTYKHFNVNASVEPADGEMYVFYSGEVGFEFDDKDFAENLPFWEEGVDNHKERRDLEEEIKKALSWDIGPIEEVLFEGRGTNTQTIGIRFNDDDSNGNLESLEHFLDYIDRLDGHYEEYYAAVRHTLWDAGYLENKMADLKLKNFTFEFEEPKNHVPEYYFESGEIEVGNLEGISKEAIYIDNIRGLQDASLGYGAKNGINPRMEAVLARSVQEILGELSEVELSLGLHGFAMHLKVGDKHRITQEEYDRQMLRVAGEPMHKYENVPVYFDMNFAVDKTNDENAIKAIKLLDKNFGKIVNDIKDLWERIRQEHLTAANVEDPHEHHGVKTTIREQEKYIKNHLGQDGKVSVKNVGGKLVYWYDDQQGEISLPLNDAMQMMRKDNEQAGVYRRTMSINLLRMGHLVVKYIKGKPTYYWRDEKDETTMPIDDAISYYTANYAKTWGHPPRD